MNKRTRLVLIRHGETTWNSSGRFQGMSDVGLSETGRQQAISLRERFRGHNIKGFYASDLNRAMETGSIIAAPHGLEVCPVEGLREINFGFWEGLTYKEICARFPVEVNRWLSGEADACVPGGEDFSQVKERSWLAVKGIVERHPGETVLLVTHGGTIRSVLSSILNVDSASVWHIAQNNAAVNIIKFLPRMPVITLLNDTSHLAACKEEGLQP